MCRCVYTCVFVRANAHTHLHVQCTHTQTHTPFTLNWSRGRQRRSRARELSLCMYLHVYVCMYITYVNTHNILHAVGAFDGSDEAEHVGRPFRYTYYLFIYFIFYTQLEQGRAAMKQSTSVNHSHTLLSMTHGPCTCVSA